MKRLYVASSWKNPFYPAMVKLLRDQGFDVWDWQNPPDVEFHKGFAWQDVDINWQPGMQVWTGALKKMLDHPRAQQGFHSDLTGMMWADTCVLLLPSGRSAHMEAGYMSGRGKPVHVLRIYPDEPDLMHLLFDEIHGSPDSLIAALNDPLRPIDEGLCKEHSEDPQTLLEDGTCPICDKDK